MRKSVSTYLQYVRQRKLALMIVIVVAFYLIILLIYQLDPEVAANHEVVDGALLKPHKSKGSILSFLFRKKKRKHHKIDQSIHQVVQTNTYCHRKRSAPLVSDYAQDRLSTINAVNSLWNDTINGPWKHWNAVGFCRNHSSLLDYVPHSVCQRPACFYSRHAKRHIDIDKLRNVSISLQLSLTSKHSEQMLQDITWHGDANVCVQPSGGQLSPQEAKTENGKTKKKTTTTSTKENTIETSFVIALDSSDTHYIFAVDAISEIFRTASETNSAEYIVSYDFIDPLLKEDADNNKKSWSLEFLRKQEVPVEESPIPQRQRNTAALNLLHNLKELFGISVKLVPTDMTTMAEIEIMTTAQYALSSAKQHVEGEFIALVTYDVLVLPGWLTMLKRTLTSASSSSTSTSTANKKVGMVGPMYLDPLGNVLEAGGMIYRDGSTHHVGLHFHPKDLSMHHARAVDFVSTACILMHRELLQQLPTTSFLSPMTLMNSQQQDAQKLSSSSKNLPTFYLNLYVNEELSQHVMFQPFATVVHVNTETFQSRQLQLGPNLDDAKQLQRMLKLKKKLLHGIKATTSTSTSTSTSISAETLREHYQLLLKLHRKLETFCPPPPPGPSSSTSSPSTAESVKNIAESSDKAAVDAAALAVATATVAEDVSAWKKLQANLGTTFYRETNRVLFLEDVPPEPDRDAGSIRLYEFLHILLELNYAVTFEYMPFHGRNIRYSLPLLADGVNMVIPGTLHDMAKSIEHQQQQQQPPHGLKASVAISAMPYTPICPWKAIIIARRDVFLKQYDDVQRICPHIPIIFDTVDVHFIRELRLLSYKHNISSASHTSSSSSSVSLTTLLMESEHDMQQEMFQVFANQQKELDAMKKSKITMVVSSEEKRILQKIFKAAANAEKSTQPQEQGTSSVDVRIISNIYQHQDSTDLESIQPQEREGAVFAGNMCHSPNVDAVDFILQEILKTPSRLPKGFKMHLVLSRSKVCLNPIIDNAARHPLVEIHRDISNPELLALHQRVKTVLAPVRYGAGVKGKVNYGLLHGVPVIATRVASEGMGLVNGKHFYLAETGEEFIQAITELYENVDLFKTLAKGGQEIMKQIFDRDVAKEQIRQAMSDIGAKPVDVLSNGHCPFVGLHDGHQVLPWNSYWYQEETSNGQCEHVGYFPLYPRMSFQQENQGYLTFVE